MSLQLDLLSLHRGHNLGALLKGNFGRYLEPIEAALDHIVLLPDDFFGPGIANKTRHPGNGFGVLTVHPMAQSLVDLHLMDVPAGILAGEPIEFGPTFSGDTVAVVGRIVAAHEDSEGQISKSQKRRLIGMTGHHGGGRKPIGHAGGQLPDSVAPGRITHQINPIRTHPPHRDIVVDETLEHRIDVSLMPQIPRIRGSPRGDVESLAGLVQANLVLPLLIIHRLGCPTAPVHGNPQAPLPRRCLAKLLL